MKVGSTKPSKQRNALRKVKNHQVNKLFITRLDEALQAEYGVKRMPLRVNDSVKIISGEFEGIEGKVLSIDKHKRRVTIEEATLQKRDGSNYYVPVAVSKLVLTKFETKAAKKKVDPWREDKMMGRKLKLETLDQGAPKKTKGDK
jgi:large subunit ribosomal protein L24